MIFDLKTNAMALTVFTSISPKKSRGYKKNNNDPPVLMSNQGLCFQGGPLNSSLFYRKVGHGPDGWVVGMDLEESSFIISTRLN